ncbi:uncharacterized protein [Spinacia oleracea]|uniref:DUF4283 domain-containing protein n=1 Tax=Spinacia oleracea TaxID=3562 RepID=A0A9R0HSJ8_SPIOL|nr:uncharacterized protein LOC110775665 [Spinacia oleracea]
MEKNALISGASTEEHDLITRSTKKPKRKITHLIFNQEQDVTMNETQQNMSSQPNTGIEKTHTPILHHGISFRDLVAADQMQGALYATNIPDDDDILSDDDEPPEGIIDDPRGPTILLSKEEKKRLRFPWKFALIVKMFDSKIGYMSLIKRLKKKWELKGGLTLTDVGHDYFIARFSAMVDYNHVLTQGPWMLDDNYLTIKKWVPNFIPDNAPMRHLTTWVRIPHLSVEYFDKEFLTKIGGKIGKVIRIDQITANADRGQFTRLSVELDLSKPLLSKFWLKGKIWRIQYEGLKMIFFNCGKIGHSAEKCPTNADAMVTEIVNEPILNSSVNETEKNQVQQEDFGAWMLVKKPPPRKRVPQTEKTVVAGKGPPKNPATNC